MRRRRSYSRRRLSSRRRRRAFCRSAARIRAKRPPETVCPVSSHPFSASSSAISSTSDPFTPSVLEHLRALPSVPGPALSSSSAQSSPQGASAADPLFLSHPDTSALLLSVASAPSAAARMSPISLFDGLFCRNGGPTQKHVVVRHVLERHQTIILRMNSLFHFVFVFDCYCLSGTKVRIYFQQPSVGPKNLPSHSAFCCRRWHECVYLHHFSGGKFLFPIFCHIFALAKRPPQGSRSAGP